MIRSIPSLRRISFLTMLCVSIAAAEQPANQVPPTLREAPAVKRLNNLVSELASVDFSTEESKSVNRVGFEMPKDGWVYIGVQRKPGAIGETIILLDDATMPILAIDESTALPETMRLLSAGPHTLEIRDDQGGSLRSLIVRAVPQIVYYAIDDTWYKRAKFDYATPRSYQELWDPGILPNFNIICSDAYQDTDDYVDQIQKWRGLGRQWVAKVGIASNAEQVETKWAKPMADPRIDGVMADEFNLRKPAMLPFWISAIEDLSRRPELKGKSFYAFSGFTKNEKKYLPLTNAVVAAGYYMAPEVYCRSEARQKQTPADMMRWRNVSPGVEKSFVYFLGPNNATNGMTFHLKPELDYKVLLEKQVAMLANDLAFADLAGVGIWAARYMDDDLLRWYARLVRHYFIEGQTTPLGTDPITLTHLQNPGFEDGEAGWKMEKASADSLGVRDSTIAPYIPSAYCAVPEGKNVLYTKRSSVRPNRISQTVSDLVPGRIYHLNVYVQDINNIAKSPLIDIGIELNGAELLPDNSVEKMIVASAKAGRPTATQADADVFLPDRGNIKSAWQHSRRLFRATSPTAELILSDWPSGGPSDRGVGQELIWDFIDIAPDVSLDPVLPPSIFKSQE